MTDGTQPEHESFKVDASAGASASNYSAWAQLPQPIYQLPHDHRLHAGAFYQTNDFNEWQYFTAIGTDKKTGERLCCFVCPFHQGWVESHGGRHNPFAFVCTNLDTEEFYSANTLFDGEYRGSAGDPDSEDFSFEYSISGASGDLTFGYDHATETWHYTGHSEVDDEKNAPYAFDVQFTVKEPG